MSVVSIDIFCLINREKVRIHSLEFNWHSGNSLVGQTLNKELSLIVAIFSETFIAIQNINFAVNEFNAKCEIPYYDLDRLVIK